MVTKSKTCSSARTALVGCQIRTLMKRLWKDDDIFIDEVIDCVLDGAAKRITFCAMKGYECMAKLSVEMDLERHAVILSRDGDRTEIPENTVLIETNEVIRAMLDYTKDTGWEIDVIFTSPSSRTEELRRRLNLRPCKMPEVDGKSQSIDLSPYELEELSYRLVMKE